MGDGVGVPSWQVSCGVLESVPETASAVDVDVDEVASEMVELSGDEEESVVKVEGRDETDK